VVPVGILPWCSVWKNKNSVATRRADSEKNLKIYLFFSTEYTNVTGRRTETDRHRTTPWAALMHSIARQLSIILHFRFRSALECTICIHFRKILQGQYPLTYIAQRVTHLQYYLQPRAGLWYQGLKCQDLVTSDRFDRLQKNDHSSSEMKIKRRCGSISTSSSQVFTLICYWNILS